MRALIQKAGEQLIRRRFTGVPDLTAGLYASLVEYLAETGALQTGPFDGTACKGATLEDIADDKIRNFLLMARQERHYVLSEKASTLDVLTHLNLLAQGRPSHAAILLFGREPQRFLITSEVKCMHFHGTEVHKPIPSYQIYRGTVFELVNQALDFVMSKINRAVGTREHSVQAPVTYELPEQAVKEAIVNAVAHRDYTSNASVQVMLFADRLEVWNPGHLPPSLTMERLRRPHASIPHNPLIADPLFLVRYVEKAGSGILDAITLCRQAGLPEPDFRQDGGQFVMTIWRNWLTAQVLENLNLNDRQEKAITYVREKGRIGNAEYQVLASSTKKTASRDLDDLVRKKVFAKFGTTGRGTYYRLSSKGDMKGTKGTLPSEIKSEVKGDIKGTNRTRGILKRSKRKGSQRARRAYRPSRRRG